VLSWNSDFSYSDLGIETEEGIATTYCCINEDCSVDEIIVYTNDILTESIGKKEVSDFLSKELALFQQNHNGIANMSDLQSIAKFIEQIKPSIRIVKQEKLAI
jgi:hypothetical protein